MRIGFSPWDSRDTTIHLVIFGGMAVKLEWFSSAFVGALGAATAVLTSYGLSWGFLFFCALGVFAVLIEGEDLSWRDVTVIVVFNSVVSVLGGSMVAEYLSQKWDLQEAALYALVGFSFSYVAHDLFSKLRAPLVDLAVKMIRTFGGQKN